MRAWPSPAGRTRRRCCAPLPPLTSTAPQVTSYLIGQAVSAQRDPFIELLIGAGKGFRAAHCRRASGGPARMPAADAVAALADDLDAPDRVQVLVIDDFHLAGPSSVDTRAGWWSITCRRCSWLWPAGLTRR